MRYFSISFWLFFACLMLGLTDPAQAVAQYNVNADGTVTDATTGLTWKRCAEGQTWNNTNCTGTATQFKWSAATALTATFAGQSDWRLPTIRELLTLTNLSSTNTALDSTVFPNLPVDTQGKSTFWSRTPYFGSTTSAWFVHPNSGQSGAGSNSAALPVRLVRGDQAQGLLDTARPDADYVDQGDGTVLHKPTGLTWQRCLVGQYWSNGICSGYPTDFTWQQARVAQSNFARQSDWRLPSGEELHSLVDYNRTQPAANVTMFPQTLKYIYLWTDAEADSSGQTAWWINLNTGVSTASNTSSKLAVQLVRGGVSYGSQSLTVSKTGAGEVAASVLPGIECGAICKSGYATGDVVTLHATPAANLTAWGGDCANAGAVDTCTVTMNAAKNVTATFKDSPLIAGLATELVFSSADIRITGAAQKMTLRNTGTAALTNLKLAIASGDFAQTNTCPASLAPGDSCSISVTFTPTVAGAQTGLLVLDSNAPGGNQSVNLSGTLTATAPDAPSDVSAIAGNTQASVSFVEPGVTGGSTITKYTVTANPGGRYGTAASGPITVTGLTNDVSYTFTVKAFNSAGYGVASATSNSVIPFRDVQNITFGPVPTLLYGGSVNVSATATASCGSNCVANLGYISYGTNTPGVCTVTSSGRVSAISMGNCVVTADMAQTAYFAAAAQAMQSITVGQAAQGISFGAAPDLQMLGTGQLSANGGLSGNAVVFSSTTPSVCTVTGNLVTSVRAGDCIVAANQAASTNYSAAAQSTQTIVISPGVQTITFGPAPTIVVDHTGVLSAAGGASGNAVVFSSLTPSICTVIDGTVSASNVGNCLVAANQAASADYQAASQVTQSIAVGKGSQNISFGLKPTLAVGSTGTLTATGGASGNAVVYSSATSTICTVTGNTVSAVSIGDCVVVANQAGNANYTVAPQVTQTIVVGNGVVLLQGWNLLGNATAQPINVASVFGDTSLVTTVWKWDAVAKGWKFYAPNLSAIDLENYVTSKGYSALTVLNPGDGFWVNAKKPFSLGELSAGMPYRLGASEIQTGWNLVATADNVSPNDFNRSLTDSLNPPPLVGSVPINLTSLWAWDSAKSQWYFYAPGLDGQSSAALSNYARAKGYLDFSTEGKTLGNIGFWVNKP